MENTFKHREEDSPANFEAQGQPSPATAWNGMGTVGSHKPPSFAISSCFGYIILSLCVLFMSAEGLPQGEECRVEQCSKEYEKHRLEFDILGQGPVDSQTVCAALRSYRHCINKTVGCHGSILYYTIRAYVRQEMELKNCSSHGQTVESATEGNTSSKPRPRVVPAVCQYQGRNVYRHCSLFGDPHLRTFYDEFQTCKAKGAWPLVNNDYLTVQVTNDAVLGNSDATATSKLTVIVKGNPECTTADFQTYQAQTNSLPGTFEDGPVSVGPYNSLELVEVDPGRHVEIHIGYINTVVVIRQIGRYFAFFIRMPEELVNLSSVAQDMQLCVRGCPRSEIINYQEYLANRKYESADHEVVTVEGSPSRPAIPRAHAETICREAKLVDFYFDSCVFDLMSTGDQNFALSAMNSLMDVLKLHPSAARSMVNRTSLDTYDQFYGNNRNGCSQWRTHHRSVFFFVFALLVCVMCFR